MKTIEELITVEKNVKDKCILSDKDVILVKDASIGYLMIHKRISNDRLVVINRWPLKEYQYGMNNISVIKDLNLFKVQESDGNFDAIYNYKEGKFIISQNIWNSVDDGFNNKFLKKYNGFLATLKISSDYEEDDTFIYDNPITEERIVESFSVNDYNYYAILNIDGKIRDNKLFKGESFSKIIEIIDLDNYESLDEFKNERKQLCNYVKEQKKNAYYESLKTRNDNSISPYLDSEVAKVLNLKK